MKIYQTFRNLLTGDRSTDTDTWWHHSCVFLYKE